ncbi:hypothetical protein, partial [Salmonella sp. SKLX062208]|uniref:hypothetical protein n=1 Tax=Salmonella sp. SKLX062208 TaxID=3159931 RepID=UPI003979FBD4
YFLYHAATGSKAHFLTNTFSGRPKYSLWSFFIPCCHWQQSSFFNQHTFWQTQIQFLVIFCTMLPLAAKYIF